MERYHKGSPSKYRNFLDYLREKAMQRDTPTGFMARIILKDVERGGGACYVGKNLSLPIMTKNLMSLNAPENCFKALRDTFNEWNKFLADEQKEYKTKAQTIIDRNNRGKRK